MQRRNLLKIAALCGGAVAAPPVYRMNSWWMNSKGIAAEAASNTNPIAFSHLGYHENPTKLATLRAASEMFTVRAVNGGAVVLRGKPGEARDDAASGHRVQVCDFSPVRQPGMYVLETDAGKSAPVEIGNDVYRPALWLTMRGYYGQRCGCNVDLGNGYSHPVCHLASEFHATSGKSGPCKNHGGWHDAGDYGRYMVNSVYPQELCFGRGKWQTPRCEATISRFLSLVATSPTFSPRFVGISIGCLACRTPTEAYGTSRPARISVASSCPRTII